MSYFNDLCESHFAELDKPGAYSLGFKTSHKKERRSQCQYKTQLHRMIYLPVSSRSRA